MGWKLLLVLMVLPPATGDTAPVDEPPTAAVAAATPDPGTGQVAAGLRAGGCRFAGSSCEARSRAWPSPVPGGGAIGKAAQSSPTPVGAGSLVLGGGVGWFVGLAAGFGAGYLAQPDAGEGYFGPGEWWLGAALGSSIGTAAGVHIAGGGQGSLVLTSLAAAVALPAGMFAAVPLAEFGDVGLLAIPAAQIGAAVLVERLTRRQRSPPGR